MGRFLLRLNSTSTELKGESNIHLNPFFHGNRPNKPKKSAKLKFEAPYNHKFNALLYNAGSTDYVISNKKWFVDFDHFIKDLPVLETGGGLVYF